MAVAEIKRFFNKYRFAAYHTLFQRLKEREGSLSATETFAVDVIYLLGRPTIKQFSDSLGISQPNATYKVASLMKKGYVQKETSKDDKREFFLVLTDKFYQYHQELDTYANEVEYYLNKVLTEEEKKVFEKALKKLNDAIM